MQKLGFIDCLLDELQHGLKTCHVRPGKTERIYPAQNLPQDEFSDAERNRVAGLMRVNNAGLYRGQALTAKKEALGEAMLAAAEEENEHLNWCQRRLDELDAGRSLLDGVWYWGSFSLGALAGVAGDRWSLGFVRETEQQVCRHLDGHLANLPLQDQRSRAIIETMRTDEARHAASAKEAGAAELPAPVKSAMRLVSKVMTLSAYRI